MTQIKQIYRTGNPRVWTVLLGCGHKRIVPNADVKREQLYVGKPNQRCAQCDEARIELEHVEHCRKDIA